MNDLTKLVKISLILVVSVSFGGIECKGGGSGGGRGGGGGRTGSGKVGGRQISGRKAALVAIPVAGVVGYAAYKTHQGSSRFHSNPVENPAFIVGQNKGYIGGDGEEDYKTQESTYYNRQGMGLSAFGILALILGAIGLGTFAWYCYIIGIPLWKDRMRNRNRQTGHEEHPLQETPSTATPSP